jgi:Skp family chaperone for outer membrane proteins
MKKFLLTLLMISAIAVSSLAAESFTITLVAYVPEKVVFAETENGGYQVNSNSTLTQYSFNDADGNTTDAYNASTFNVVAA